jgi:hypothetical protein
MKIMVKLKLGKDSFKENLKHVFSAFCQSSGDFDRSKSTTTLKGDVCYLIIYLKEDNVVPEKIVSLISEYDGEASIMEPLEDFENVDNSKNVNDVISFFEALEESKLNDSRAADEIPEDTAGSENETDVESSVTDEIPEDTAGSENKTDVESSVTDEIPEDTAGSENETDGENSVTDEIHEDTAGSENKTDGESSVTDETVEDSSATDETEKDSLATDETAEDRSATDETAKDSSATDETAEDSLATDEKGKNNEWETRINRIAEKSSDVDDFLKEMSELFDLSTLDTVLEKEYFQKVVRAATELYKEEKKITWKGINMLLDNWKVSHGQYRKIKCREAINRRSKKIGIIEASKLIAPAICKIEKRTKLSSNEQPSSVEEPEVSQEQQSEGTSKAILENCLENCEEFKTLLGLAKQQPTQMAKYNRLISEIGFSVEEKNIQRDAMSVMISASKILSESEDDKTPLDEVAIFKKIPEDRSTFLRGKFSYYINNFF